ncbi:hypothetical protein DFH06DRAFT_1150358 [Mycena polygramma]|nr:hypothetical protein DFH06DRAFT_1150358 [Mycena polygramma]
MVVEKKYMGVEKLDSVVEKLYTVVEKLYKGAEKLYKGAEKRTHDALITCARLPLWSLPSATLPPTHKLILLWLCCHARPGCVLALDAQSPQTAQPTARTRSIAFSVTVPPHIVFPKAQHRSSWRFCRLASTATMLRAAIECITTVPAVAQDSERHCARFLISLGPHTSAFPPDYQRIPSPWFANMVAELLKRPAPPLDLDFAPHWELILAVCAGSSSPRALSLVHRALNCRSSKHAFCTGVLRHWPRPPSLRDTRVHGYDHTQLHSTHPACNRVIPGLIVALPHGLMSMRCWVGRGAACIYDHPWSRIASQDCGFQSAAPTLSVTSSTDSTAVWSSLQTLQRPRAGLRVSSGQLHRKSAADIWLPAVSTVYCLPYISAQTFDLYYVSAAKALLSSTTMDTPEWTIVWTFTNYDPVTDTWVAIVLLHNRERRRDNARRAIQQAASFVLHMHLAASPSALPLEDQPPWLTTIRWPARTRTPPQDDPAETEEPCPDLKQPRTVPGNVGLMPAQKSRITTDLGIISDVPLIFSVIHEPQYKETQPQDSLRDSAVDSNDPGHGGATREMPLARMETLGKKSIGGRSCYRQNNNVSLTKAATDALKQDSLENGPHFSEALLAIAKAKKEEAELYASTLGRALQLATEMRRLSLDPPSIPAPAHLPDPELVVSRSPATLFGPSSPSCAALTAPAPRATLPAPHATSVLNPPRALRLPLQPTTANPPSPFAGSPVASPSRSNTGHLPEFPSPTFSEGGGIDSWNFNPQDPPTPTPNTAVKRPGVPHKATPASGVLCSTGAHTIPAPIFASSSHLPTLSPPKPPVKPGLPPRPSTLWKAGMSTSERPSQRLASLRTTSAQPVTAAPARTSSPRSAKLQAPAAPVLLPPRPVAGTSRKLASPTKSSSAIGSTSRKLPSPTKSSSAIGSTPQAIGSTSQPATAATTTLPARRTFAISLTTPQHRLQ